MRFIFAGDNLKSQCNYNRLEDKNRQKKQPYQVVLLGGFLFICPRNSSVECWSEKPDKLVQLQPRAHALVAQWIERAFSERTVAGSNPAEGTIKVSQIGYVDILILSLYNGSNILYDLTPKGSRRRVTHVKI